jgi:glutaredoxin
MCAGSISRERVFVVSLRGRPAADEGHTVTLVTRAGCHLCEVAETTLRRLRDELGYAYAELDVDADPALLAEYSDRVPVILLDGREHGYWRVEQARLRKALAKPVRR